MFNRYTVPFHVKASVIASRYKLRWQQYYKTEPINDFGNEAPAIHISLQVKLAILFIMADDIPVADHKGRTFCVLKPRFGQL